MNSVIEYYCGSWESDSGNRIEIELVSDQQVKATFYRSGEHKPMLRPWFKDAPATDMIGVLDAEAQSTLDIFLAGSAGGFCLNLSFDLDDGSYKSVTSSITRYEEDKYLDQYYHLLGPLGPYKKVLTKPSD